MSTHPAARSPASSGPRPVAAHARPAARAAAAPAPAPAPAPDGPEADREQRIRELAYRHYLERGCVDGHELEDWLRAEAQVD